MSIRSRAFHTSLLTRIELLFGRLLERVVLRRQLDRFCYILGGHIYFQTLSAAVELDLFTLLADQGPLTRARIAELLGIQEKPARILLLGCVSLGLLRKKGDRYAVNRLSRALLSRTSSRSIVPIVRWQHHINYKPLYDFADAIRENDNVGLRFFEGDEKTLYERLAHRPELEKIFQEAMQSISAQANDTLCRFVNLGAFKHIVDVGGGNGTNLMAMAKRYPGVRGTVFDSPSVCNIARARFEDEGLADRLDAVAGNCFEDPLPTGCDCIIFCHFLTIWSEAKNRLLLTKAHAALPSGGAVMIFNMMQHDDESGPLTAALGSPYFLTLATGESMLYTWQEYRSWVRESGFTDVEARSLPRDHGVILGIKP